MLGTEVTEDAASVLNFSNQHGVRKANPSLAHNTQNWVRKTQTRCNKQVSREGGSGKSWGRGGAYDQSSQRNKKSDRVLTQEERRKEGYQTDLWQELLGKEREKKEDTEDQRYMRLPRMVKGRQRSG